MTAQPAWNMGKVLTINCESSLGGLMFTKESGHLYWVSMLCMCIAAIYTEGSAFGGSINHLFIKRCLKIIYLTVWRYI